MQAPAAVIRLDITKTAQEPEFKLNPGDVIKQTPRCNQAATPMCCGSQTSLAWLANISFRGLRFADTIRTRRLAFAASELRFIVTGVQTSGEGSPSVPMAVCHPYGQHTLCKNPQHGTRCLAVKHATGRRRAVAGPHAWPAGAAAPLSLCRTTVCARLEPWGRPGRPA
jgi:hypothetical protein